VTVGVKAYGGKQVQPGVEVVMGVTINESRLCESYGRVRQVKRSRKASGL
jgi:hypothetical protein